MHTEETKTEAHTEVHKAECAKKTESGCRNSKCWIRFTILIAVIIGGMAFMYINVGAPCAKAAQMYIDKINNL